MIWCYVTTISCNLSHTPKLGLLLHIYWLTVGAQEPIGQILHVKISLLFLQTSITHLSLYLLHLLTGLQQQMQPCVWNLSVGLSGQMWTGNVLVCRHDWLCDIVPLRYVKSGSQQDSVISILAPTWCLPPSQWPLLKRLYCLAKSQARSLEILYSIYQLIYPHWVNLYAMSHIFYLTCCRVALWCLAVGCTAWWDTKFSNSSHLWGKRSLRIFVMLNTPIFFRPKENYRLDWAKKYR